MQASQNYTALSLACNLLRFFLLELTLKDYFCYYLVLSIYCLVQRMQLPRFVRTGSFKTMKVIVLSCGFA